MKSVLTNVLCTTFFATILLLISQTAKAQDCIYLESCSDSGTLEDEVVTSTRIPSQTIQNNLNMSSGTNVTQFQMTESSTGMVSIVSVPGILKMMKALVANPKVSAAVKSNLNVYIEALSYPSEQGVVTSPAAQETIAYFLEIAQASINQANANINELPEVVVSGTTPTAPTTTTNAVLNGIKAAVIFVPTGYSSSPYARLLYARNALKLALQFSKYLPSATVQTLTSFLSQLTNIYNSAGTAAGITSANQAQITSLVAQAQSYATNAYDTGVAALEKAGSAVGTGALTVIFAGATMMQLMQCQFSGVCPGQGVGPL